MKPKSLALALATASILVAGIGVEAAITNIGPTVDRVKAAVGAGYTPAVQTASLALGVVDSSGNYLTEDSIQSMILTGTIPGRLITTSTLASPTITGTEIRTGTVVISGTSSGGVFGTGTFNNPTLTGTITVTGTSVGSVSSSGTLISPTVTGTLLGSYTRSGVVTGGTYSSPILITPTLGVATATTVNKITLTQPSTGATLTLADNSSLITSGAFSTTLTATATTALTLPTSGTLATVGGNLGTATGTSLAVTAGLTSSGATGAGIGYATGAGGVIAQSGSRTGSVVLSKLSGQITTDTTSLGAETAAEFTVTNTTVAINDVVVVSIQSGSNGGNTSVNVTTVANGSFKIKVSNNNAAAGTAETGAIIINFAVIKAVSS